MSKNQEPFLEIISTHQRIIHKVCRLYAHTEDDRADLFQEILLQLWRAFGSFKGESKISTWMYRVALNTAISGFRKSSRRPATTDLDSTALIAAADAPSSDAEEETQLLYKAIAMLSDLERAIIMLYLEEQSYEEIGEVIGITPNYVGVKINRIKSKLKDILSPHLRETRS
ncbi:MAG: RNA polymerase sigma factor [Bacteroidia bacterium]|nr:RNA polymerase sigma factor [Bacteroidia bacterium]